MTITEEKASTADDARLLKEVEKEAWASITKALLTKCENNTLEYIEFEQALDPEAMIRHMQVLFTLNGVQFTVKVDEKDDVDSLSTVLKTISDAILRELHLQVKKAGIGRQAE